MRDFNYKFAAIRGVQSGMCFYQACVPFRVLGSLLKMDDHYDVNKRSQRELSKSRAKAVAKYLEKNKDGFYIIPPLVGFIEGDCEFVDNPLDTFPNLGNLMVPMESQIMLFDGQHRAFGIREVLALAPELGQQTVSIMFFIGMTLSQRKQAFHDINFTQKTPAAALCIAYNERDPFDVGVVDVFKGSNLRHLVEYEKNTASGISDKVYSLKALKDFAVNVVGKKFSEEAMVDLEEYAEALFDAIPVHAYLAKFEAEKVLFPAQHLREMYTIGHAVTLKALGLLAAPLKEHYPSDWKEKLEVLRPLTIWNRWGDTWLNRCVNQHGKMVANQLAVRLTLYKLKELCGVPLTEAEASEERAYFEQLEAA